MSSNSNLSFAQSRDERIVQQLHRYGVRHLTLFGDSLPDRPLSANQLLCDLAGHQQERLRSSLILLFLRRPALHRHIDAALGQLSSPEAMQLKLYYQAAVYLQRELESQLRPYIENWEPLPDLFSRELDLPVPNAARATDGLSALAALHRVHSDLDADWAGSYRHYIPLALKLLREDAGTEVEITHS